MLDHIILTVSNVERSLAFYEAALKALNIRFFLPYKGQNGHPERIQPGRPQQNGRHERMHRTLKEDTTKPPALTLRLQQRNSMASGGCSITSARTKASTTRRLAVSISPVP
jgi:hypothetical protein